MASWVWALGWASGRGSPRPRGLVHLAAAASCRGHSSPCGGSRQSRAVGRTSFPPGVVLAGGQPARSAPHGVGSGPCAHELARPCIHPAPAAEPGGSESSVGPPPASAARLGGAAWKNSASARPGGTAEQQWRRPVTELWQPVHKLRAYLGYPPLGGRWGQAALRGGCPSRRLAHAAAYTTPQGVAGKESRLASAGRLGPRSTTPHTPEDTDSRYCGHQSNRPDEPERLFPSNEACARATGVASPWVRRTGDHLPHRRPAYRLGTSSLQHG